jgi:hypothetical protein
MDKRKTIMLLIISSAFLTLAPATVRADKPYKKYRIHDVYPDQYTDGKWITHITIVSFLTDEPGVYRVTATFMMAYVGPDDMWVRTIHYTGTSESWTSIQQFYLVTGKMEYTLQYTVFGDPWEDDGWDGNYRIWFEDGAVVKQAGSGLLWLP